MIESDFLDFLSSLGLEPRGGLTIGKIARADVVGKKNGRNDGAYLLNTQGDRAWGWAQNHQAGTGVIKWSATEERKPVAQENGLGSICSDSALLLEQQKYKAAQGRASRIYNGAGPCHWTHPYFMAKRFGDAIKPYLVNLRAGKWTKAGKTKKDCIIVPLHDVSCVLHSIQSIDGDGQKDLLFGAKKADHFFALKDFRKAKTVILTEGLATALSVQITTPIPVVMCVDSSNLVRVAVQLKAVGINEIIVAADHDSAGIEGARQVKAAVGAKILMPQEPGLDWDDVRQRQL